MNLNENYKLYKTTQTTKARAGLITPFQGFCDFTLIRRAMPFFIRRRPFRAKIFVSSEGAIDRKGGCSPPVNQRGYPSPEGA
jgi:hypothetical protein